MDISTLEKDLKQLRTDIEQREQRIARYEKLGVRPVEDNYSYVFDFAFPGVADIPTPEVHFPLQEKTVQIKKDTIFFVKSITQSYTVVGTRQGAISQAATLTLPMTGRLGLFAYRFKIHDTGSDREWQDNWVNGAMLLSGNYNGYRLRRGHALCSPGSEVTIQIDAKSYGNDPAFSNLESLKSQRLQIVLSGFEVPFKKGAV